MTPRLTAVVSSLKIENTTFAAGIASKMDYIEEDLRPILAATRTTRAQISFFDVVRARAILQSANPFTPLPLSATAGAVAAKSDPANVAQQLNVTLDDVLNANHAIATAGTGGIIAAVNDLIARAQAAQTLYTALSK